MPTLCELFAQQVAVTPDRVAVATDCETLTYAQLDARSGRLAAQLCLEGVGADDIVGVYVEPSLDLMVGVWGVLRAAAAYLPLSPEYPDDRIRYMVEDARVRVIFTQPHLAEVIARLAPPRTKILTTADFVPDGHVPAPPRPDHLAYVIYTSGSTGRPKGVMIEHHSIAHQMLWLRDVFGLDEAQTVLQKTPMSFDAAQWEILAIACGSKVVMGTPGVHRDAVALIETVQRHQVTMLQCVPTVLQALVDSEQLGDCRSLTHLFSGGEPLSKRLAQQCLCTLPGCALTNLYGPTECTINSSTYTVDRRGLADGPNVISIGRPVAGLDYHVLDSHMNPVPDGETGELFIAGVQLARGYLHRPDATAERFIDDRDNGRWYRTGDLVRVGEDRTFHFVGRADNQVKLRGHRIELDEIRLAIETHDWVRNAAVVVNEDPSTGTQKLLAFVELNPAEAALMDQGEHSAHHQSKQSRLQVRAQLSNQGCRNASELDGRPVVALPGAVATQRQRTKAFARKTYRFYEGGEVTAADILRLLRRRTGGAGSRDPESLTLGRVGEILRNFGQFTSEERLLPKYAYASPGSLYATQMYLEVAGIAGLAPGVHYYHPLRHHLVRVSDGATSGLRVHFVGKRSAIEPVYKHNIQEVLEIEAGHMVGLFDEVLPAHGLAIRPARYHADIMERVDCAAEDFYLGSFEIVARSEAGRAEPADIYVQTHPGRVADLPAGLYRYHSNALEPVSPEIIDKKHVIAINQQVYERASFGITVVSRTKRDWLSYVDLGRRLQRLQMNQLNFGFMSSGYSSKTGHDLRAATRMTSILTGCGLPSGPCYFFLGGRVSEAQLRSTGMNEDVVHMRGPAEMIKDELASFLPDFMIPHRVVVLGQIPTTANGKVDPRALQDVARSYATASDYPFVAPRSDTEQRIAALWQRALKLPQVSVVEDFFDSGGNSLIAVSLVNAINRELGSKLPLQVLFDAPTVERLAAKVDALACGASRLIRLRASGSGNPVYCWPGLGGYVMNLRLLASKADLDQPWYGIQAHGLNEGETPYATIEEMAARDIEAIQRTQPDGPYTLWGYSFGARVAFEAALQLEQAGAKVDELVLVAPGSPRVDATDEAAYVAILRSVFAGSLHLPVTHEWLRAVRDENQLLGLLARHFPTVDRTLIRRITNIVGVTYGLKDLPGGGADRKLNAPVIVLRARHDERSFIEDCAEVNFTVIDLDVDHYGALKEPGVDEVVRRLKCRM